MGVNESNAHLAACAAGLGIVQTFAYAAKAALRDGALVEIEVLTRSRSQSCA